MITPTTIPVPVPDTVAVLIGRQIPARVREADADAERTLHTPSLYRTPQTPKEREHALADLAAANKVPAAHSPKLIVRRSDIERGEPHR